MWQILRTFWGFPLTWKCWAADLWWEWLQILEKSRLRLALWTCLALSALWFTWVQFLPFLASERPWYRRFFGSSSTRWTYWQSADSLSGTDWFESTKLRSCRWPCFGQVWASNGSRRWSSCSRACCHEGSRLSSLAVIDWSNLRAVRLFRWCCTGRASAAAVRLLCLKQSWRWRASVALRLWST